MAIDSLFSFSPKQLDLSLKLKTKIITQINNNNGFIPFSQYMNMALYDQDFGYYNNLLHKFGKFGDFTTAPIVSSLFATMLGRQLSELYQHGVSRNILEIGAGNGQLMLDLLAEIGLNIDTYYILEISASLALLQRQRLQESAFEFIDKVVWLNVLPHEFDGVILANEVLDAQPCEIVHWQNADSLYMLGVGVENTSNKLKLAPHAITSELDSIAKHLPVTATNYTSEINLNNRGFIKDLAASLQHGCILLIDYGYGEAEYYSSNRIHGTLRSFVQQHILDDVLSYPGLVDITASVDFTAIANHGINNGLDFIGYTTQEGFLLNCGIVQYVIAKKQQVGEIEYLRLSSQVNHLTSVNEMGEVFKVIGFAKGVEFADWLGFKSADRSYTLCL